MASSPSKLYLFGGEKPWSPLEWTSSDDRVRGGSSISHLNCTPSSPIAVFNGNLDIKTLGGAGFASQRTIGEDNSWDLSKYDGLELHFDQSDGKQYTIILKDELLPKNPNGREQSTVSWEYDFRVRSGSAQDEDRKVFVVWDDLKPTYRGRDKKDATPLDLKSIKRFSIMMRSFFGTQEGDFSLSVLSMAAFTKHSQLGSDFGDTSTAPFAADPKREYSSHGECMSSNRGSYTPKKEVCFPIRPYFWSGQGHPGRNC